MAFMNVAIKYGPQMYPFAASGGGSDNGSLASILSAATQLLTWFITSMGSFLSFIVDNPVILMMFLILLVGSAVSMLLRVWHSA